jgi:hypothetical protein
MSAPVKELPRARLVHRISGDGEQEWPEFMLLAREQLSEAAALSDRLAAATWQITLHDGGEIVELVACKRHHTLHAAVDELLALQASGSVYLDAPDLCSTISYANLGDPGTHYPVDEDPRD